MLILVNCGRGAISVPPVEADARAMEDGRAGNYPLATAESGLMLRSWEARVYHRK
jgi:hypothetical protein